MEKLNDYLRQLLASCSEELRLEPDKKPYLVTSNKTIDITNVPILGTQISTMVFPLIPAGVRDVLPHRDEIEFVHPHSLGNFSFVVRKSPAGFNVTIRPSLADGERPAPAASAPAPLPEEAPSLMAEPPERDIVDEIAPEYVPSPETETPESSPSVFTSASALLEKPSAGYEYTIEELEPGDEVATVAALEDSGGPEIEIASVNDPSFSTVFSDTSTYEPPGRRDDLPSKTDQTPAFEPTPAPAEQMNQYLDHPAPIAERHFTPAPSVAASTKTMDGLFAAMADAGASDLHLSVSMPPMVRKDGKMRSLREGDSAFTPESMRETLMPIMPQKNREEFEQRHDTDFAYEIPGLARFRCNVFMDRKGMGAVFRIIPTKILTAEQLGLSQAIMNLCELSKGLVVVTGPTGSGKSTTLCAMVDHINKSREDHIITIEDPIEFVHDNQKCLVNQREVHNHTDSFKDALRAALREDPDILLVGEMRDLETISIAIETAETGHLVFGTLHTTTAASTVDRIIDQFPADRQQQIRVMLSESLKGVIAQTLLPKKGGGRVAALEVLIVTPAISNLIREGKTFQIPSAMQTGKNVGMVMLNDALFEHVKNGLVEPRDAYIKAVDKTGFEMLLQRGGFKL